MTQQNRTIPDAAPAPALRSDRLHRVNTLDLPASVTGLAVGAAALTRAERRPPTLADYDAQDAAIGARIARQRARPPLRLIRAHSEGAPRATDPKAARAPAPASAPGWRLSSACCGTGECGDCGCEGHPANRGPAPEDEPGEERRDVDPALRRRVALLVAAWCMFVLALFGWAVLRLAQG